MSVFFARLACRRLLIGCLALCFVWQPILLAAAEAHEAQHGLQTGHAHDDAHPEAGIPADDPDGDGMLHSLMHIGHCCSFPAAVVPAASIGLAAAPPSRPAVPGAPLPAPMIPASLWRPPIPA
jgi:hypothetical protein